MTKLLKITAAAEFILAMLIISETLPAAFAYVSLAILLAGIWKLSSIEALQLYILSIPILISLPANSLSEAMSIWRIALLLFVLRVFLEKFEIRRIFLQKGLKFSEKAGKVKDEIAAFVREVRASNYYKTLIPAIIFMAIGAFSLLFAQSIGAGIKKMIFLGSVASLFSIVYFAAGSRGDVMKILKTVFISAIFILLVGYLQLAATFFMTLSDFWGIWDNFVIKPFYGERMMILLSYSNTWFSYYGSDEVPATLRMFSVMPDSHSFSMLMILFAPLALFYSYGAVRKSDKVKYFALFAFMLLAIFFSGSRGAWVGWIGAISSALYFYLLPKFPKKMRPKAFLLGEIANHRKTYKTVFLSVLFFVALFPVTSYVLNVNQDVQLIREGKLAGQEKFALLKRTWSISDMDETSNKGRMEIWKDSIASIAKHPVTGIGLGNFPLALSEKISTSKMGASAHNVYLDIAVEMGLFALLAFLLLLWRICVKLFSLSQKFHDGRFRLLAASSLVHFIWISTYGFFDVVIFNDKVFMFTVIIMALLYKMEDISEKEELSAPETVKS